MISAQHIKAAFQRSNLALLMVSLGLVLPSSSLAKDAPPTVKPFDLPALKDGPLTRRKPRNRADILARAKKDRLKRPRKRPATGTDSGADVKDEAKGAEKKDVPKWRETEETPEKDTTPTLNADFLQNCARLRPGVRVTLDLYDEDLDSVAKIIACMTGQNIILAKPLKGKKITIYSPVKVTAREMYKAFLTALQANGLTISRQGKFLRIIDANSFQGQSDPILPEGRTPPNEDRMVTQIISLEHVDAQEISDVITKLASSNAKFIIYQPTNSLIITEVASNLRKLRGVIRKLDVPGGQEQLWTYQILNSEASDIASKILEIFEKEGTGGKKKSKRKKSKRGKKGKKSTASSTSIGQSDLDVSVSKVIADERTNRLFIITSAKNYKRVKRLIAKLDVAIPGDGQVHIHQLNHAKAADLASVLSNLSSEQSSRRSSSRRKSKSKSKSKKSANGTSAALFEGDVNVTADEDTNSLVVTASLKDFHALRKVIDILDRPRRQVFIEAVVMEVTVSNDRSFGLEGLHGIVPTTIAGEETPLLFRHNGGADTVGGAASIIGLSNLSIAGFIGSQTVNVGGTDRDIPAFGVILNAMATSSDVNILSTPHLLATDNEEAEIVVGENVPFPVGGGLGGGLGALGGLGGLGGAAGGLGGLASGFGQRFQRQDVALTLKLTPRINASNFVTLEIDQTVEEVVSNDELRGPTTSKRSIKTTVQIQDQQTVVIGGLQKNRELQSSTAIPILGEIPILGYFFRKETSNQQRTNLLLMITPHVIDGPDDFQAIYERKMEEQREFVARFRSSDGEVRLGVDYGKKHGALETINKAIKTARDEEAMLEELRNQNNGPPLPQDLDGLPLDPEPGQPKAVNRPYPTPEPMTADPQNPPVDTDSPVTPLKAVSARPAEDTP